MSVGWVKKWKKPLQEADPEDEQVLHSRSQARIPLLPPERIGRRIINRVAPGVMRRPRACGAAPRPKRCLYYLPRDEQLEGERLPRSSRTISRILQQAGRIAHRLRHLQESQEQTRGDQVLATRFEGCLDGGAGGRRQAAARGGSARCHR